MQSTVKITNLKIKLNWDCLSMNFGEVVPSGTPLTNGFVKKKDKEIQIY
jgi:hypothetical protein